MTNAKHSFTIRTNANDIQIKPSTVDANTVGYRVTDPADLTVGRWYAVFTNATSPHTLLRAKYIGTDSSGTYVFKVCPEDYDNVKAVSRELARTNSNIRTGKDAGGGVFGVYKFKQVKEQAAKPGTKHKKSSYSIGNCKHNGIKVGDKFVVVSSSGTVPAGTTVTLTHDDGTMCPYFEVPGRKTRQTIYLWRLAPVSPTGRMQPTATLSTVDQFKSEIDALRAKVAQKRDQIAQLSEEIAGITVAIDDTRQKFKASLDGYI